MYTLRDKKTTGQKLQEHMALEWLHGIVLMVFISKENRINACPGK